MAIIYSVHYITDAGAASDADDAARQAARKAAVLAAYRLAHTAHGGGTANPDDTTLTPTIAGADAIAADGWYVIKIDTSKDGTSGNEDTQAAAEALSGTAAGIGGVNQVWLNAAAAGRVDDALTAFGGVDEYIIDSSFSVEAAKNDGEGVNADTHVTITDTGRNIYRFRNDVIIKSAVIEDGALKITFGGGTAPGLTINNVIVGGATGGNGGNGGAAGSFRFGSTNNVAFTASEFVKHIRTEVAKPATPDTYTVVDTLMEDAVPGTITFTESAAPGKLAIDKSAQINRGISDTPETEASGMLIATPEMGAELATITHNGADVVYGDFTFTLNAENTGGVWKYTPDPTDRDSLRLRDFRTSEIITFTATDNTGAISTRNVVIDITVAAGTDDRNLAVGDQYSGQATAIIRGVLFTVNDRGAGGNGIEIIVSQSTSSASSVLLNPDPNSSGKSVYNIFLGVGAVITPEFLKDLWDNRGTADVVTARTSAITATIIDPDIPDATRDQLLGRYITRGGADDVTDAIADENDDKATTLDWTDSGSNDLTASGRLAILDPNDGSGGSTVDIVSRGKYGTIDIPTTGTGAFTIPGIESDDPPITTDKGIFDWTYTLDLTYDDTRALTGEPAVAASATLGGLIFTANTLGAAMNGYNIVIQADSAADANDALISNRLSARHLAITVPENAAEYPKLGKIKQRLEENFDANDLFTVTYAEGSTAEDQLTALVPNTPLMGGAETKIYDLVTISVTDKDGMISFYDIPIAITVAGALREASITIGIGETAETYAQSGENTLAPISLTENPKSTGVGVYSGKVILANVTATFFMGGDARAITPTLDAASVELGFAYDAMTGNITFSGRIDYESLTDANATAAGVQHRITLTARGGSASDGGVITTTHFVDVTIIDADQPPVINTAGITTHSDVSAVQKTDIPADVTITGADAAALYFAIDENETPSDALFTIPATDADGDTITYTLEARDANGADVSGNFTINTTTGDMTTGAISLASGAMLDHEASAYIRFEVTATSTSTLPSASGAETATQQVILLINDIDEDFVFTADSPTTVTISANATTSTPPMSIIIGTVKAADPDEDAPDVDVMYSLDEPSKTAGFMIDEDSGAITYTGASIDLGTAQAKEFTLTITAMGGTSNRITHTLAVIFNDDTPPQPVIDTDITFDSGAFIFTKRQLDANDVDTGAGDLTYMLTGLTFADDPDAALQVYDSTGEMWTDLAADGSGSGTSTFTQEQVNDGHVRLVATSDGTLSVRVSDETTTDAAPMEITFTVRVAADIPPSTEVGGAGGDNNALNFNTGTDAENAMARSVTTGIGNTEITLGSGNDKVDAGLGDDAIDLSQGGEDTVIYRFGTDADGNTIAWSGGDAITGFTPGEDELVLSDVDGGDTAFIDGLGTGGFVATLTTAYTGGNSGDRTSIADYNVTGVEIHFNQAVVLPGGVLGGSILSVEFAVDAVSGQHRAWADFNSTWLGSGGFDSDSLLFNANADGEAALANILGLRDADANDKVTALRSVAVGDDEANTIDLSGGNGASVAGREWVIDGGGGNDMITLHNGTEEVIYRLTYDGTDFGGPDGSDTITGFTLGVDSLTFVDTDGTTATLAEVLGGLTASLTVNSDGNYADITLMLGSGGDTLAITFATPLDADALNTRLGAGTSVADFFGTAPLASTTANVASAELEHIADLFGADNISVDNTLPTELL